ncbi:MAG: HPr family phosphocarrier protein [Ethanoligenens sp.]
MTTKEFTVNGEHGFHMRPAQVLLKTATAFVSDIMLERKDGSQANAKSLLNLMSLGLEQGQKVLVKANGPDERQAIQAIEEQFNSNFGE